VCALLGATVATAGSAGSGAAPDVSASSTWASAAPLDTLSPTLTSTPLTVPACGDGISMVALSLSRVTSDCSLAIVSPGATRTSITFTCSKSPMSGSSTVTVLLMVPPLGSAGGGRRLPEQL